MKRLALFAFVAASVGCSSGQGLQAGGSSAEKSVISSAARAEAPADYAKAMPASNAPESDAVSLGRDIVRRGSLSLRVDDVESAEREVQRLVAGWRGYVESADSTDLSTKTPSITLNVRVPVKAFDRALVSFEGLGTRLAKSIGSEDVTGQLVDLDARIRTMRAQEETYRGLLRQAKDLKQTLLVEDRLSEVRAEIESITAQRKTLGELADLSTISLTLTQALPPNAPPKDPNWLAQTWAESTTSLGSVVRGLTSVLLYGLVFTPLWLPVVLLVWRFNRPSKRAAS
jgi:hypothetical protein